MSEEPQNENLSFTIDQIEEYDEIPHATKDSMFISFDIVRSIKELDSNGDMSIFMSKLNKFLHIGNAMRPNVDDQRTINKMFIIVTLRQIITKLTRKVHFGTEDNRHHSE